MGRRVIWRGEGRRVHRGGTTYVQGMGATLAGESSGAMRNIERGFFWGGGGGGA